MSVLSAVECCFYPQFVSIFNTCAKRRSIFSQRCLPVTPSPLATHLHPVQICYCCVLFDVTPPSSGSSTWGRADKHSNRRGFRQVQRNRCDDPLQSKQGGTNSLNMCCIVCTTMHNVHKHVFGAQPAHHLDTASIPCKPHHRCPNRRNLARMGHILMCY